MGVFRGAIDEMLGGAFRGYGIDGSADAGQLGRFLCGRRSAITNLMSAVAILTCWKRFFTRPRLSATWAKRPLSQMASCTPDLADFPEETKVENPPALIHAP